MTLILAFLLQRGPVEGVLFTDYGTDLGSGNTVPGTVQTRLSCFYLMHLTICLSKFWNLSQVTIIFVNLCPLGDPAGARLKPGSGYGYGFGVRVDSPLGPLRLEYAFNDKHNGRFHFGVGQRT